MPEKKWEKVAFEAWPKAKIEFELQTISRFMQQRKWYIEYDNDLIRCKNEDKECHVYRGGLIFYSERLAQPFEFKKDEIFSIYQNFSEIINAMKFYKHEIEYDLIRGFFLSDRAIQIFLESNYEYFSHLVNQMGKE